MDQPKVRPVKNIGIGNFWRWPALWALPLFLLCGCPKTREEKSAVQLDISGAIECDPSLVKRTKGSDVIFLIAKSIDGGPPVAVKKFTGRDYPYSFKITQENLMLPVNQVNGPLNLTVRVDKDGDAGTRNAGDLAGTYHQNPVSLRSERIVITVNEVME